MASEAENEASPLLRYPHGRQEDKAEFIKDIDGVINGSGNIYRIPADTLFGR